MLWLHVVVGRHEDSQHRHKSYGFKVPGGRHEDSQNRDKSNGSSMILWLPLFTKSIYNIDTKSNRSSMIWIFKKENLHFVICDCGKGPGGRHEDSQTYTNSNGCSMILRLPLFTKSTQNRRACCRCRCSQNRHTIEWIFNDFVVAVVHKIDTKSSVFH